MDDGIMSLFKLAINTKMEVRVNMLENKSRIKNKLELEILFKKGK